MRLEKENVHEECKEGDQQGRNGEDEEGKKVARRVRGLVEMRCHCKTEADQRKEAGDRMHDKDGGEGVSRVGRKAELVVAIVGEKTS